MEPDHVLEESREFLEAEGLPEVARELPRRTRIDAGPVAEAVRVGFAEGLVLPAPAVQTQYTMALVRRLLAEPAAGVAEPQQYDPPDLPPPDRLRELVHAGRPARAYLLLWRTEMPPETRGLDAERLAALFRGRGWSGLTLPEYLVVQRRELLRNGDHRFDAADRGPQWLPDSRGAGRSLVARWAPDARRVSLEWCDAASCDALRGAYPTRIFPCA